VDNLSKAIDKSPRLRDCSSRRLAWAKWTSRNISRSQGVACTTHALTAFFLYELESRGQPHRQEQPESIPHARRNETRLVRTARRWSPRTFAAPARLSLTLNMAGEDMGSSERYRRRFLSPATFSVLWGSIGAFSRKEGAKPDEGELVGSPLESSDCEELIAADRPSNPSEPNSHGRGRRFETCCAHSSVFATTLAATGSDDGQNLSDVSEAPEGWPHALWRIGHICGAWVGAGTRPPRFGEPHCERES